MKRIRTSILLLSSVAVAMACGSNESGAGGGRVGGSGGALLGAGSGDNGTGSTGTNGCDPQPDSTGCVGERFEGEAVPLDIYVMFDQSASMDCTIEATYPWSQDLCDGSDPRITPVREALSTFLNDPLSAGIGVGVGYFGYMRIGDTSCDPADYDDPAVPIDTLPGHARALIDSLESVSPTGETPTGAAIRGACQYLEGWHAQHSGHKVVILLVTDGVPEAPSSEDCSPPASIADAVTAATECIQGESAIQTYVVGVGQALDNLNRIAQAGGTNQAYLVDGGNVSQSVLQALNAIRGNAQIPCELTVPRPTDGQTLSLDRVNIGICDAAGANVTTHRVPSPSDCGGGPGGWYYEEAGTGTRVVLCEPTCETVSAAGATLFYSIGCQTINEPR